MKKNRIERRVHGGVLVSVGLAVIAALVIGLCIGYGKLRDIYLEQCVITDMSEQVSIVSGKMVKSDVIAENLGLKVGANTALIDFADKRKSILQRIHTLRELTIHRKPPNKVFVTAEERTPIAKMGIRGRRQTTGRVVDSEGVVFICQRGTQLLPTIYESQSPGTQPGQRLRDRAKAALILIETCRESEFSELNVLDVDIAKPDYLTMTLGSYSIVKIAWEGMDCPGSASDNDLRQRLRYLIQAIRTQLGTGAKTWNATMPNAIFADTQEKTAL